MPTAANSAPPRPAPPSAAGYRGLRVWQRALDLAVEAAPLARTLAAEGYGGLASDLFRAATAVPAHIAAGSVAGSRADHQHALGAALGAMARFETLVATSERLAPNAASGCAALLAGAGDVTRSLRAFARVIGGTSAASPPAPSRPDADAAQPADVAALDTVTPATEAVDSSPTPPASDPAPAADGVAPPMSARPARARRARSASP